MMATNQSLFLVLRRQLQQQQQQQQVKLKQVLSLSLSSCRRAVTTTITASHFGTTTAHSVLFTGRKQQQQQQQQQQQRLQPQPWQPRNMSTTTPEKNKTSYEGRRKAFGGFHFGTNEYAACFAQLPYPSREDFRREALNYLKNDFDPQSWYNDPITTIVNGQSISHDEKNMDNNNGTVLVDTYSALGQVNGKQVLCSRQQLEELVIPHIKSFVSKAAAAAAAADNPKNDYYRDMIRQAEQDLLTSHAGALIGNQCVDFAKQDGVTELEEQVMATVVERRLNDYLLLEENMGRLVVNRQPIYVHCVSNFGNFLDLSRKVLRSLEVGIPVVILGRSNQSTTQQHAYRWAQLLIQETKGLDPGMITYISTSLDNLKWLLQTCRIGNLYMTGSRELAASIKSIYPNTIASTGGPNTMVIATPHKANPVDPNLTLEQDFYESQQQQQQQQQQKEGEDTPKGQLTSGKDDKDASDKDWFTPQLKKAIQISATIESSGQCTALRHVILPPQVFDDNTGDDPDVVRSILSTAQRIESPQQALELEQFDGVFSHEATESPPASEGYHHDVSSDTYYKVNYDSLPLPPQKMKEYWRKAVVDFTRWKTDPYDYTNVDKLAHWLNQAQPISLAVNGNMVDSYKTMRRLFDRTALAVYTVGGIDNDLIFTNPVPKRFPPALTCQARPQDGEIFGEVPPRPLLHKYTKYPVYIPSSNPSYDASYTSDYLVQQGSNIDEKTATWNTSAKAILKAIQSDKIRGYCCLLIDYLRNVDTENPKLVEATPQTLRTVLFGIQRPPLQTITIVRAGRVDTTWDACAPAVILFFATTARDQLQVSVHPGNTDLQVFLGRNKIAFVTETDEQLQARVAQDATLEENSKIFQVVSALNNDVDSSFDFPMVGQFTSLFFPFGHVKSTAPHDADFLQRFKNISNKWLAALF